MTTASGAAALPLAHVLPVTAEVNPAGRLSVGGCDLRDLADQYGTPLYVYDTATLRAQLRGYREAFTAAYPDSELVYASKAFLNRPFARFIASEGFGFDVVSGGEIATQVRPVRGVRGCKVEPVGTSNLPRKGARFCHAAVEYHQRSPVRAACRCQRNRHRRTGQRTTLEQRAAIEPAHLPFPRNVATASSSASVMSTFVCGGIATLPARTTALT